MLSARKRGDKAQHVCYLVFSQGGFNTRGERHVQTEMSSEPSTSHVHCAMSTQLGAMMPTCTASNDCSTTCFRRRDRQRSQQSNTEGKLRIGAGYAGQLTCQRTDSLPLNFLGNRHARAARAWHACRSAKRCTRDTAEPANAREIGLLLRRSKEVDVCRQLPRPPHEHRGECGYDRSWKCDRGFCMSCHGSP